MQEQQTPSPADAQGSARYKPPKRDAAAKLDSRFYEPYVTPAWFWVSLRSVARALFFLLLNIKVVGRHHVPKSGPCLIASNHLSWTDIPLVPAYTTRRVIYTAKEDLFEGKWWWVV